GSTDEPNLLQQAEEAGTIAEIQAEPSAVTNLLQTAQTLLNRAERVLSGLEGFVDDARGPLTDTVNNVQRFSKALSENADGIDNFLASVGKLSDTITGVSDQLSSTLASAEELLNSVDRDKIGAIVDNVEQVSRNFRDATADLDQIMGRVEETVATIRDFSADAQTAIDKVNAVLDGVDPATVSTALTNFEQTSTTINADANDIAQVP